MSTMKNPCLTDACIEPAVALGSCKRCYARLRYQRSTHVQELRRAYRQRPEVQERRRKLVALPTNRERTRALAKRRREHPAVLEKERVASRTYSARPEIRERDRARYRAHCATRRSRKLNATPIWVDHTELALIYKACPPGHHVDHIVPLQNEHVCGLHTLWNLQYLPANENCAKGNKFELRREE